MHEIFVMHETTDRKEKDLSSDFSLKIGRILLIHYLPSCLSFLLLSFVPPLCLFFIESCIINVYIYFWRQWLRELYPVRAPEWTCAQNCSTRLAEKPGINLCFSNPINPRLICQERAPSLRSSPSYPTPPRVTASWSILSDFCIRSGNFGFAGDLQRSCSTLHL